MRWPTSWRRSCPGAPRSWCAVPTSRTRTEPPRGINYRLCENGFIDNDGDREKFNGNLDELARIYLECFGITAGSAPAAVPQPQPAQETTENFGGTYRCTVDYLRVRDAPAWAAPRWHTIPAARP